VARSDQFRISAFQVNNVREIMISFPCICTDQRQTGYHGHTSALFAHSHRYQAVQLINLKVQSLTTAQDKLTKQLAKKIASLQGTRNFVTKALPSESILHEFITIRLCAPSLSIFHFNNIPAPWLKYPNSGLL